MVRTESGNTALSLKNYVPTQLNCVVNYVSRQTYVVADYVRIVFDVSQIHLANSHQSSGEVRPAASSHAMSMKSCRCTVDWFCGEVRPESTRSQSVNTSCDSCDMLTYVTKNFFPPEIHEFENVIIAVNSASTVHGNPHMEEVGLVGGSNKHQTFAQEAAVHVPCETKIQRSFILIMMFCLLNLTK